MQHVICIGHVTLDIFYFLKEASIQEINGKTHLCLPYPEKVGVERRMFSIGGNAANVGVGLRTMNHAVMLVTQIGQDPIGMMLQEELHQYGFDLSSVVVGGESDSSVILHYNDDRTILSYHTPTDIPLPPETAEGTWAYLTSLGETDIASYHHNFTLWLESHPGIQVVFNPGRREIEAKESLNEIVSRCHTLIVNKEEAIGIIGEEPESIATLISLLKDLGPRYVVITDSKEGAYLLDQDALYHMDVLPVEVIETTGAGDAFSSGYMGAIVAGKSPVEGLKYGIAQSASSVTAPGATSGLLTLEQLDGILRQYSEVTPQQL